MEGNIYSNPDKFDLVQVAHIDYSSGGYEFDYRVIWRDVKTGKLWTARDSGCSCPTPFDNFGKDNLEPYVFENIEREAKEHLTEFYNGNNIVDFLAEIRPLKEESPAATGAEK